MSNDDVNERTLDCTPYNPYVDDTTLGKHMPTREPQPDESDDIEPIPERQDPEPRELPRTEPHELPRKDCRVVFTGAL